MSAASIYVDMSVVGVGLTTLLTDDLPPGEYRITEGGALFVKQESGAEVETEGVFALLRCTPKDERYPDCMIWVVHDRVGWIKSGKSPRWKIPLGVTLWRNPHDNAMVYFPGEQPPVPLPIINVMWWLWIISATSILLRAVMPTWHVVILAITAFVIYGRGRFDEWMGLQVENQEKYDRDERRRKGK